MKVIGIEEPSKKNIDAKKILIKGIIVFIVILIIILAILYGVNQQFRGFMDKYVLMKNVQEDNVTSILIDESQTNSVYAYDKYIAILNQNKLIGYGSSGKKEYELTVEVNNPLVDINNRFLLIAEQEKQKIYLISGNSIVWEKELEGNISRVSVNKNGYVSVVVTGTASKSIIQTFDETGKELFKAYLSRTIVVDTDISNDNKYLSFAEINTNGASAKSLIKTISIQKAKDAQQKNDSIISTISAPSGSIVINLKYQDGNRLMCMYNDRIGLIQNENENVIFNLEDDAEKVTFSDIELTNHVYEITEKSSLLRTKDTVKIINVITNKTSTYELESAVKETYSYNNTIALNLGSEVHFIDMNGWLSKKYTSSQEIKKVVLTDNFAGIVYRDKIEIVEL